MTAFLTKRIPNSQIRQYSLKLNMEHPKIRSAKAVDAHTLLIEFDNSTTKTYDIRPLWEKEMFFPLTNAAFFENIQVDKGGYAIFWDENIDLSEYELWTHGNSIET